MRIHPLALLSSLVLTLGMSSQPSWADRTPLIELLRWPEAQRYLDEMTQSRESLNKISLLHLGKNSTPVRHKLIQNAENYVFMTVPIWVADTSGNAMLESLRSKKASMPELDLRIMQDLSTPAISKDFKGKGITDDLREVTDSNLRLWNDYRWARRWSHKLANNRLHDKMLIVDGRKLVMGGMNITNEYLEGGLTREGWHDSDVLIEGPVAQDAARYFTRYWEFGEYMRKRHLMLPLNESQVVQFAQDLIFGRDDSGEFTYGDFPKRKIKIPLRKYANSKYFPELPRDPEFKTPLRLIYDNPMADRDPESLEHYSKIGNTISFLLENARERVRIFLPYLTITKRLKESLTDAARRGIQIEIITNSLKSHDVGDNPYFAATSHYKKLISAGIKIYEWQGHEDLEALEKKNSCEIPIGNWPGRTIHTKAVIVDGQVTLIGSHNMNVRSELFNNEVMALALDRGLSSELESIFEHDLDQLDQAARIIPCGDRVLERPRMVEEITLEKLNVFLKKYAFKIWLFKQFQAIM